MDIPICTDPTLPIPTSAQQSPTMRRKIMRNQRFHKYESLLRRIRQRVFDYEDAGTYPKALRIIQKIKTFSEPFHERRVRANESVRLQNYMM